MIQVPEWFIIVVCFMLFFQLIALWWLAWQFQLARDLISAETIRKEMHTAVFEKESDPEQILSEMERTADFIEQRNARRLMAPRPDAGPPAIVHRPPLRSVQPRSDRGKFFKNMSNEVDTEVADD